MKKILNLYKPVGKTPLQLIIDFKQNNPEYKDKKMAYAGRLDPMACGVLLVLVGEECANRDKYQDLDKTYEFKVLKGFSSDTYDILGISQERDSTKIRFQKGVFEQKYPVYSSKPVKGKPLFWWAREDKLDEIEVPSKKVAVKRITKIDKKIIDKNILRKEIIKRINVVQGNFRQDEIIENWNKLLTQSAKKNYTIEKYEADVSSGTYIRSLIHKSPISKKGGALAFEICRTRVGEYKIENSLKI